MRATFYEALEVAPTAESSVIRAALRTVLRRFWSVPRDPSGDTEEAVRFVALGAAILTDDGRREEYDTASRRGAAVNPWRVGNDGAPLGDSRAMEIAGGNPGESGQLTVGNVEPRTVPAVFALTDPLPEHGLWATSTAYIGAAIALVVSSLFVYFSASLWLSNIASMMLMIACLFVSVIYAAQAKIITSELSGFTLSRLAITKWRRETSVFVGNPPPQQDTAWIFRLRVMELTRSSAGYSSALHVLLRTIARLADYAMIAIVIWLLSLLLEAAMSDLRQIAVLLRSPLVLPIAVVLIAVPLEAMWIARWRTTPGKFLLGVVVALGVTKPDDDMRADRTSLSRSRAWAFARDAAFYGIWPLAALRASAIVRTLRVSEGSWEAAGDSISLVRATPLFVRAAGVSLALSLLIGLAAIWADDARGIWGWLRQTATTTASSAATLANESISAVKESAAQLSTPSSPARETATPPQTVPPVNTTPAQTAPDRVIGTPPPEPAKVTPSAPAPSPAKAAPPKTAQPPAAPNEFERQTALAQERRARIERAEKRVAAARSSGSYAGLQGVCERWTEDSPGSAEAWRCLGLARYQAGAGRDALPALRQSLKLEPNDSEVEGAILRILRP
jgi:hypothetical protein